MGAKTENTRKRTKFDAWHYYRRVEERDADGQLKAVKATCIKCNKVYSTHPRNGTSHVL